MASPWPNKDGGGHPQGVARGRRLAPVLAPVFIAQPLFSGWVSGGLGAVCGCADALGWAGRAAWPVYSPVEATDCTTIVASAITVVSKKSVHAAWYHDIGEGFNPHY